jgi:hypothetical protein
VQLVQVVNRDFILVLASRYCAYFLLATGATGRLSKQPNMHALMRRVCGLGFPKTLFASQVATTAASHRVFATGLRQLSGESTGSSIDAAHESPLSLSRRAGAFAKLAGAQAAAKDSAVDNNNSENVAGTTAWIHPLSELVLNRIRSTHADFDTCVTVNSDGTIRVETALGSSVRLETAYVVERKCHLMLLYVDGEKVDEAVMQDYSKSAWQVHLISEDALFEQVDKLCEALRTRVQQTAE